MQEIALPIKKSIVVQEAIIKPPPRRKLIPIKFDEIKNIGETMKYRLMAMDIQIH